MSEYEHTRAAYWFNVNDEPYDECEHCGTHLLGQERLKSACPDCIADGLPFEEAS